MVGAVVLPAGSVLGGGSGVPLEPVDSVPVRVGVRVSVPVRVGDGVRVRVGVRVSVGVRVGDGV